jgi:CarD family transcriptional regulator
MFSIGDKVAYPMHGAGIVENIEDRQILGSTKSYYIVRTLHGNMQIMVPVNGCEQVGLRCIVEPSFIDEVMGVLGSESTPMDDNWNRRNRDNMERMKTGDLKQVAGVIRNLLRIDRVKKLSTGEKQLLNNARQILASEMVLVNGITEDEAQARIESAV